MTVKKYYTRKEVDKIMYSYIRETAEELKISITKKKIKDNKVSYV